MVYMLMISPYLIMALYLTPPVESGLARDLLQTCSKETLPVKEGVYWSCEKEEPTLGDTCRLECSDDKVVEHEMLLVCTTLGWGPKQPSGEVPQLPACQPNVCPSLLDKRIHKGGWECMEHNKTKSCKNHRTGAVCSLKCLGKFKAALGHVSVCTDAGWLPKAENLRCYGCKIPMNPAHGRWNCDVEKSGTTVCLLECDPQFAIKGSHIIECDLKQEIFDPDPVQSVCAEAKIRYDYDFKPQTIIFDGTRGHHKTHLGSTGKLPPVFKRDKKSGELLQVGKDEIITNLIDQTPLFTHDPFNPQIIKQINPEEFKSTFSAFFNCENKLIGDKSCPKQSPPSPCTLTDEDVKSIKEPNIAENGYDTNIVNDSSADEDIDEEMVEEVTSTNLQKENENALDENIVTDNSDDEDTEKVTSTNAQTDTEMTETEDTTLFTRMVTNSDIYASTETTESESQEISTVSLENQNGVAGTKITENESRAEFQNKNVSPKQVENKGLDSNEGKSGNQKKYNKKISRKFIKNDYRNERKLSTKNTSDSGQNKHKDFIALTVEAGESNEGLESTTNSQQETDKLDPVEAGLPKDCKIPPWATTKHGEWKCEPPNPPYLQCTLSCKKAENGTVMAISGKSSTWTCDKNKDIAWNVSKTESCNECDKHSYLTNTGRCKCVPGYAGDGFTCGKDKDQDGRPEVALDCEAKTCKADNCPDKPNAGQEDTDKDGLGDVCDHDPDNDGIVLRPKPGCSSVQANSAMQQYLKCLDKDEVCHKEEMDAFEKCFETDNCIIIHNPDQKDTDDDTVGDVCDNCPKVLNADQKDTDEDGIGDACDDDMDNDGVKNTEDNCKIIYNKDQKDTDGDTFGDVCDNCPSVSNKGQNDINQNLIGDDCEKGEDTDKDGFVGEGDNCPDNFNANQMDIDKDNIGDLCDDDIDGDGVPNIKDNCPLVGNPSQEPAMDGKGSKGKACYNDYDGDGVDDNDDVCPENPEIKHTDFRNLETMDLCETSNVKRQSRANSCTKPKPMWDKRDNGKEIYQGRNSRVSIAVSRTLFGDVDYNGTLFVDDEQDNDWVGIVWGMMDINHFYMLISNRQKVGEPSPLYWQIKSIEVTEVDDPNKFDKMIFAIRENKSIPGFSTVLWSDPLKQQWKIKTSTKWVLNHRISTNEINLRMYEGEKEIIHAHIKVPNLIGGRLGVFCMSQERVTWSAMNFACPVKHFMDDMPSKGTQSYKEQDDEAEPDSNEAPSEDGSDYYESYSEAEDNSIETAAGYIKDGGDISDDSLEAKKSKRIQHAKSRDSLNTAHSSHENQKDSMGLSSDQAMEILWHDS